MADRVVTAWVRARPGKEQELESMLRMMVEQAQHEPGCLKFALHRSAGDPAVFVAVERWASQEALDRHFAAMMQGQEATASLVAEPPHVEVLVPVAAGDPAKSVL